MVWSEGVVKGGIVRGGSYLSSLHVDEQRQCGSSVKVSFSMHVDVGLDRVIQLATTLTASE